MLCHASRLLPSTIVPVPIDKRVKRYLHNYRAIAISGIFRTYMTHLLYSIYNTNFNQLWSK